MKKSKFALMSLAVLMLGSPVLTSCGPEKTSNSGTTEAITIQASSETVFIGKTITLIASVSSPIWESSKTDVATIDDKGVVTGVAVGTTVIKAKKAGYKAGTVTITVKNEDEASGIELRSTLEYEKATHFSTTGQWGNPFTGYKDTPVMTDYKTASNGGYIGNMAKGGIETIKFNAATSSKVNFGFVLASTATNAAYSAMADMTLSSVLTMTLDGTALDLTGLVLPGDTTKINYYNFVEVKLKDVTLTAGEHTLVTTITGTSGPNMDCINVYSSTKTTYTQTVEAAPTYASIGTFTYFVEGYEWGPGVKKVMVDLGTGNTIIKTALTNDLFSVTATGASGGAREVTSIYLCDTDGKQVADATGTRFAIEMKLDVKYVYMEEYHFGYNTYGGCDPFSYNQTTGVNTWAADYGFEIKLAVGKSLTVGTHEYKDKDLCVIKTASATPKIINATKNWSEAKTFTSNEKTLSYKSYSNQGMKDDNKSNPLIIWLHGAGEGGTDPDIAILGNDVTNLGEDAIQNYFKKDGAEQGAYVLAVQTPTMWMDKGDGTNGDGSLHSIYTESLKATINHYLTENTDIDASRIYIGGCSNGGYMTMEMITTYPTAFAAAYPVCEAFGDNLLTDELVTSIKNLPIWFVASADDTTVLPSNFVIKAYQKLKAAGSTDCHFSYFENVKGNDSGSEVQYMGHWSWIYALSNRVSKDQADYTKIAAPSTADVKIGEKSVGLWEWMANKKVA